MMKYVIATDFVLLIKDSMGFWHMENKNSNISHCRMMFLMAMLLLIAMEEHYLPTEIIQDDNLS